MLIIMEGVNDASANISDSSHTQASGKLLAPACLNLLFAH